MLELITVTIVCATVLGGIALVLRHLTTYRIERAEWLANVHKDVQSLVAERLAEQANYKKDLETVNANQLKLAQELEKVKQHQQLRTSLQRPPGSLV
jgi:septal ring factor EnvC (AmiA/AmiB activator)